MESQRTRSECSSECNGGVASARGQTRRTDATHTYSGQRRASRTIVREARTVSRRTPSAAPWRKAAPHRASARQRSRVRSARDWCAPAWAPRQGPALLARRLPPTRSSAQGNRTALTAPRELASRCCDYRARRADDYRARKPLWTLAHHCVRTQRCDPRRAPRRVHPWDSQPPSGARQLPRAIAHSGKRRPNGDTCTGP